MAIDPHLAGLLQSISTSGRKPPHLLPIDEGRAGYLALTYGSLKPEQVVPVGSVEDIVVDGGAGSLKARVYRPESVTSSPTIACFHGGGFVLGNLDSHDNMCRQLCRESEAVVVSTDYRLAPENRFPDAVEDALAATRWVVAEQAKLGGSGVVGVAGDSAGGNLAAVVAQQMRQAGTPLAAQLLIYPAVDSDHTRYPSYSENAGGFFLETETLSWFSAQYLGDAVVDDDPRIAPIRALSLAELPPALIVAAQYDPLRDQAIAYDRALKASGSRSELVLAKGMIHGFFNMGHMSSGARDVISDVSQRFGRLLRGR